MRSSFFFFGLAAVALANLNQNANEMRDVSDIEGSKVEADTPAKVIAGIARPCCSPRNLLWPNPPPRYTVNVNTTAQEKGPASDLA
ncbi:hypothetical protein E4U58_000214 [Claviceps cyperi]|nr:hypothetical protein E4U58_000214 [Claviceps cyperi]